MAGERTLKLTFKQMDMLRLRHLLNP